MIIYFLENSRETENGESKKEKNIENEFPGRKTNCDYESGKF
jgi:hypothetical protein